tara:strand:+ start:55 stop:591 length:537 start_codon:yes stop_codon:yes gene_type:complete
MKLSPSPSRYKKTDITAVLIQVSGSMAAPGRREAMFEVACDFAPCDIYGNDEGKIIYCGRMETSHGYGNSQTVMMPMTGSEDTDPTFHLIGFARDYKEVIFIDDGDNTTGILTECMDVARALRIVRQIAPISGVIVRSHFPDRTLKGHITLARQNELNLSFYEHGDYRTHARGYIPTL